MRNPLAPHFMNNPDLIHPYYTTNYWRDPDVRHINARGHKDVANMVSALVQDTACSLVDPDLEVRDDVELTDADKVEMALEKILSEHFTTGFSAPLHPASEFMEPSLDISAQKSLIDEDQAFWSNQPKEARPWGPWRKEKHAEGEEGKTWEGVWPGEWDHGEVPRVSINVTVFAQVKPD
jgi:hypothetical protein